MDWTFENTHLQAKENVTNNYTLLIYYYTYMYTVDIGGHIHVLSHLFLRTTPGSNPPAIWRFAIV